MKTNTETMSNGMECSIDWLSFTVTKMSGIKEAIEAFGFTAGDFIEAPKGASGYKKMLLLSGSTLRVLYDGNKDMGVHFDVSGSAVSDLLEAYKRMHLEHTPFGTDAEDIDFQTASDLFQKILANGQVTRLDLAIDNTHDIFYTLPELREILDAGHFVSKFRKYRDIVEKETSGTETGHSLYLGSRSSELMLRVYDKQLEQNRKLEKQGEDLIEYAWVRWELELKNSRADMALRYLVNGKSIGEVCFGVLEQYFRIINLDDSNKSRCSMQEKWIAFLGDVRQSLRLVLEHIENTLEEKRNWVIRQVAPTIAGIILASYGDISFLTDSLELHAARMSRKLRELVSVYNPEWQSCLQQ